MPTSKQSDLNILQGDEHLVVFRLNQIHYAIRVDAIQQIIEMVTITPVIETEAWMEGVINYHGRSIPIIDLRRYFRMEVLPYGWHTPIILVNVLEYTVGLIVDDALDVSAISSEKIIDPRSIIPPGIPETPLLKNIILSNNKIILWLNLDHLFDQIQVQALAVTVETLKEQPEQILVEKAEKSIAQKHTNETRKETERIAETPRAVTPNATKKKPVAKKPAKATPPKAEEA